MESSESLAELDVELVQFEQNPNDKGLLSNIFRLVHTVKGTCGFLGLARLESVAHASENVLGKIRDGELEVTPEAISLIPDSIDAIKDIMAALEKTEAEPEGDDKDLIDRLNALADGKAAPAKGKKKSGKKKSGKGKTSSGSDDSLYERLGGEDAIDAAVNIFYDKVLDDDHLQHFFEHADMDRLRSLQKSFMTMAFGGPEEFSGADLRAAHEYFVAKGIDDTHFDAVAGHLRATLQELEVPEDLIIDVLTVVEKTRKDVLGNADATEEAVTTENVTVQEGAEEAVEGDDASETQSASQPSIAKQNIRVNIGLLENLMNLVSELVLTRNQLLQMVRGKTDSEFAEPLQRLSHATTELQEGVMKTRMQPIGNAWNPFPRIVRNLALELDKKIDLQMLGAETELDRQVLELIKDPLTHMVRNSGDHGIETPAERKAAGKSETGTITLNAYHEGGHIIIEVTDDGRGIAVDKVKAKAIANGLATEAELEGMTEKQIQQFIFKPGFSTAETVTNVSGRGVGMDVVKTNIEKIGGTVELKSVEGKGSAFIVKIPLTLAIVSALVVECAGERFAIPQTSVVELVRASGNSEHKIEMINNAPVLRLRERLLPLVSLRHLLALDDVDQSPGESDTKPKDKAEGTVEGEGEGKVEGGDDARETFIIVTSVGAYSIGIVVDKVYDTEEIVVKPVSPILRDISLYSGNTILGDGSVIMILDPNGIATATGEIAIAESQAKGKATVQSAHGDDRVALLLFRANGPEPKAVPLSLVARLEEVEVANIEVSNGMPVVQYRGQLMPLVTVSSDAEMKTEGRQPVVVFTDEDRSMGLVVDEIFDIVEDKMTVELGGEKPGLLGSAIIDGKATEILDAGYYLGMGQRDWFGTQGRQGAFGIGGGARQVLLVDDSSFFRNLLAPILTIAGYEVTVAESADEALSLREAGQEFDIIVSDIEMPGMDGFEFAETVKSEGSWQHTPLVALTSHATPKDFERGRIAGFDDYVAKFDRDALLTALSESLAMTGDAA